MATYRLAQMQDDVVEPRPEVNVKTSWLVVRSDLTPLYVYCRFPTEQQAQKTVDALNAQGT